MFQGGKAFAATAALMILSVCLCVQSFPVNINRLPFTSISNAARTGNCAVGAAGKGFGRKKKIINDSVVDIETLDKTYGADQQLSFSDEIFDDEAAMEHFFTTNREWAQLFLSMIEDPSVPAMIHLGGSEEPHGVDVKIEYSESAGPWGEKLEAIPTDPEKLEVVSSWLDSVQQNLVDLPVDESTGEQDDLDTHFINEGKRMLALSRFHVLRPSSRSGQRYDDLFRTCWSELAELRRSGESDTGSVILLPDHDHSISDLRRFTAMNLQRPLDWLGISGRFEVASFERGVSAVRLLHNLSEIPTDEDLSQREIEYEE